MLQNAYFLAKIGAEYERHFAEILPRTGNYRASLASLAQSRAVGGTRCWRDALPAPPSGTRSANAEASGGHRPPSPRAPPRRARGAPAGRPTAGSRAFRAVRLPQGSCQFFSKFRQNVALFRLYRHQFLQENTRFAAFFKIYQII